MAVAQPRPVLAAERDTYETVWSLDQYGQFSPGETYLPLFLDMIGDRPRRATVLDAGCGSGKGALALAKAGFAVTCCDITPEGLVDEAKAFPFIEACLWNDLRGRFYLLGGKYDYAYCCDVLEHIPTPFTMLVISRLLEVARHGVFLSIALQPDHFGAWVGKPLHQTVQRFEQWRDQIAELGHLVECRDLMSTGVYLVAPR